MKETLIVDNQARFISYFKDYIRRDGADELLLWLQTKTDFFTAPCSTKYHLCEKGGLCFHSLNVFETLRDLYVGDVYDEEEYDYKIASCAIVSLLHDICKVNVYHEVPKYKKVDGKWEEYIGYDFVDDEPYGHGEKSVKLITKFMKLTDAEAGAIRAHMGGYDKDPLTCSNIFKKNELAVYLHCADLISSNVIEW